MIPPLEARLQEAEDQCRFERAKRVELAALIGQFIERAVPLVNDAGLSLDPREFERRLAKPSQPPPTKRTGSKPHGPTTALLIFDNGGGITLQIGAYAHHYISPARAAQDLHHWLAGSDPSTWEGHDPNALAEPSSEDIRNGCYLLQEVDRANPQLEAVARDLEATGWMNATQFAAHLLTA